MNKYEMLYIIDNDATDEKKEEIIAKLSDVVTSNGGTVENIDKWGTKKYAYPINYKTEGYYVLMNFEAAPTIPQELDRQIKIIDQAVRCLILKK